MCPAMSIQITGRLPNQRQLQFSARELQIWLVYVVKANHIATAFVINFLNVFNGFFKMFTCNLPVQRLK